MSSLTVCGMFARFICVRLTPDSMSNEVETSEIKGFLFTVLLILEVVFSLQYRDTHISPPEASGAHTSNLASHFGLPSHLQFTIPTKTRPRQLVPISGFRF